MNDVAAAAAAAAAAAGVMGVVVFGDVQAIIVIAVEGGDRGCGNNKPHHFQKHLALVALGKR